MQGHGSAFQPPAASAFPEHRKSRPTQAHDANNAQSLQDLRVPPGNRLEQLAGDRQGQHSIRINDQWRICFVWRDRDAYDVEIVDYH